MEFTLEKFNPTIAELTTLSEKYNDLKIDGKDDKTGYEMVKMAQLELRDKRIYIQKTLKEYRDDAIKFQKAVINQENLLIGIIEGTEKKLKSERERIDNEIELDKRRKILPERMEELKRNGIEADEGFVLEMTSEGFNKYVLFKREEKIIEKEKKLEEENRKIDEEKKEIERQKELDQARKEGEEKAKRDQEEKEKRDQEQKEKEKADLEKKEKYQERLKENEYTESDFISNDGSVATLYRKVSTFLLK